MLIDGCCAAAIVNCCFGFSLILAKGDALRLTFGTRGNGDYFEDTARLGEGVVV